MKVRIIDIKSGLKEYNEVSLIRLKSPQVNLLIMEDHLPVIGSITGSVEILDGDNEIMLNNVDGYYMHKKNIFELIIKD